jgi:hypothetical protein
MLKTITSGALRVGFGALLFSLGSGSAFADLFLPFQLKGSTTGTFIDSSGSYLPTVGGLTFSGRSFGPTSLPLLNLGTFHLSALPPSLTSYDFDLSVTFSAPAGAGATDFKADLKGKTVFGVNTATINFKDNSTHFTFSNSKGSGSFDLNITDVLVTNLLDASIIGAISNATFAPTPEPSVIVLSACLLGVIFVVFRKKLRNC